MTTLPVRQRILKPLPGDASLILASLAQIDPFYALEKEGGFKGGDPRGIACATSTLAEGVPAVRDMIVDAWLESANPDSRRS